MSVLQDFKQAMADADAVTVTNHYIDREDHPCFGTRTVLVDANTSSFLLDGDPIRWPLARNVRVDDGAFQVFGHPTDGDLFLTVEVSP